MPFREFAARQFRQRLHLRADHEKGRAHALRGERVEDRRRELRVRAVVEGEDHLVIRERQRLRIGFQPDFEAARGPDLHDARGAEFVRPAGSAKAAPHQTLRTKTKENSHAHRLVKGSRSSKLVL